MSIFLRGPEMLACIGLDAYILAGAIAGIMASTIVFKWRNRR